MFLTIKNGPFCESESGFFMIRQNCILYGSISKNHWKKRGKPDYLDEILSESVANIPVPGYSADDESGGGDSESDPLYDEAVAFVTETRKASISSVQRKLRIGYNRAARLVEQMEMSGVVSEMGTNGTREVLAPRPPKH